MGIRHRQPRREALISHPTREEVGCSNRSGRVGNLMDSSFDGVRDLKLKKTQDLRAACPFDEGTKKERVKRRRAIASWGGA